MRMKQVLLLHISALLNLYFEHIIVTVDNGSCYQGMFPTPDWGCLMFISLWGIYK